MNIFTNLWILSLLIAFLGGAIFILYLFLRGMRLKNKGKNSEPNQEENV